MDLTSLFEPRSVAVVGASRQKGKVGYEILTGLVKGGFEGQIYPVNKSCDALMGLRCYGDLRAIGQTPVLYQKDATPAPRRMRAAGSCASHSACSCRKPNASAPTAFCCCPTT